MDQSDQQKFTNLIAAINQISARQDQIEARLAKIEATQPAASIPVKAIPPPEPPPIAPAASAPRIEAKLGLTILNRIGVVTLVLGVGFFFKWAVDNNWIGPAARVALGLLAGVLTLAAGDFLWRKGQQVFAQGITGAGTAILYLAFYAAFDFYHLVGQVIAFGLLFATTVLAATLALRYRAQAIAALGFFGAYLIPLLLSNGDDRPWFLLAYLLLINIVAAELARRRSWMGLELLSFAATVLIFGGYVLTHSSARADQLAGAVGVTGLLIQRSRTPVTLIFTMHVVLSGLLLASAMGRRPAEYLGFSLAIAAFSLAFAAWRTYPPAAFAAFVAFWLALGYSPDVQNMNTALAGLLLFGAWAWWRATLNRDPATVFNWLVFALNGLFFYTVGYHLLKTGHHSWVGVVAAAVGVYYLAFFVRFRQQQLGQLALMVAIAFFALALPIQLAGFTMAVALAIAAAILSWTGVRLSSGGAVAAALGILAFAVFGTIIEFTLNGKAANYPLLLNARFVSFTAASAALLLAAYWAVRLSKETATIAFVAGHITLLAGASLEVIGWAEQSAAPENVLSVETIGVTILFAAYAVALVTVGVILRSAASRLAGLVLTGVVILKLYLFDVWQLGRFYQIVAFVILGILLLATSFLYSRFKDLISEWRK